MSAESTTSITDDRGVRLPVIGQRRRELTRVKRRSRWFLLGDALVLGVIGFPGFFALAVARSGWVSPVLCTPVLLLVCIAIGVFMRRKVLPAMREKNMLGPTGGWLVFQGHCAACGYFIGDLTPHDDGCSVCPECGGAWRAERWMTASRADERRKESIAIPALSGSTVEWQDDRGVPLPWSLSTPPRWLDRRDLSPALRMSIANRLRKNLKRWGIPLIVTAGLASGAGIGVLVGGVLEFSRHPWAVIGIAAVGAVSGGALMLSAVVLIICSPSARSLRRAWIGMGLCPNCGCAFAPDALPEFDGCTSCRECGRAWRRPS